MIYKRTIFFLHFSVTQLKIKTRHPAKTCFPVLCCAAAAGKLTFVINFNKVPTYQVILPNCKFKSQRIDTSLLLCLYSCTVQVLAVSYSQQLPVRTWNLDTFISPITVTLSARTFNPAHHHDRFILCHIQGWTHHLMRSNVAYMMVMIAGYIFFSINRQIEYPGKLSLCDSTEQITVQ